MIGETLKIKRKNLRDSYQKYLRANATTTGQAEGASKGRHLDQYKKYNWAKSLEFLRPHLSFATYVFILIYLFFIKVLLRLNTCKIHVVQSIYTICIR